MENLGNNLALFCFDKMKKLDSGKISISEAHAQAALARQVNNAIKLASEKTANLLQDITVHSSASK